MPMFRFFKPLLTSIQFWIIQFVAAGIVAAHHVLETFEDANDLLDFIPVSLFWVPLMYSSVRFGLKGSFATSVVILFGTIPNWFSRQRISTLPQEVVMVLIAIAVSIFVGYQVDRRIEAQKRARSFATSTTKRVEEEKTRLSMELHDDPVQTLISVCHEIDAMQGPVKNESLSNIRNTINGVITSLRNICVAIYPPNLDDIGLVSAIRSLLNESSRKMKYTAELLTDGNEPLLPMDIKLAVYRIVQEAIRNVERHSSAVHVKVEINFKQDGLEMIVLDDGIGFDATEPTNRDGLNNHLGLLSMAERSEMCGGKLEILSRKSSGTRITVSVPLPKATVVEISETFFQHDSSGDIANVSNTDLTHVS